MNVRQATWMWISFVRNKLEYCQAVWEPLGARELRDLERVQTRALRAILETGSWTEADVCPRALYKDDDATLDELREAVATLEDSERIARRVFGGAHPFAEEMEITLRTVRAALAAHETPSPGSS